MNDAVLGVDTERCVDGIRLCQQSFVIRMGQGESKYLSEEKKLLGEFTIDSRNKEESLTYLTSRHTHRQYLLREIVYTAEPEYQAMLKRLQQRAAVSFPNFTNLERLENFKEENLCSNYYRIYALWEFPKKTLAEEVNYRALLKQPFEPQQLRALLLQLAEAMGSLPQPHQCLTSKTLLLASDSSLRVVDTLAIPTHPNIEVLYQKRNTKNTYLAPEDCAVIAEGHLDRRESSQKQDVFVSGMILLDCALLDRQDDCYERNWEAVNWEKLRQKLATIEGKYGWEIKSILDRMLEEKSETRITWQEIIQKLDPKTSFINPNNVRGTVRQSVIRESFTSRPPPPSTIQRVSVVPPLSDSVRRMEPRGSYSFTYQNRQPGSETVHNIVPPRVERISYEQGPVIRVVQPLVMRALPPRVIRPPTVPIQTSLSSKFTPIALSNTKPKGQTAPTATVSNHQPNSFIEPINNEFKVSPVAVEPVAPMVADVNNFSVHLTDPIFAIDEYAQGKRYEGYKVNGKKEGEGRFYLDSKLCFDGHWKDDLMEGPGKLYYQSGILAYDGNFHKDRFHGFGKLYNEAPEQLTTPYNYENFEDIEEYWISYEGYFENDLKEGRGELFLTNGEHFEGNFHSDFVEGEGIYTTREGSQVRGQWHFNVLQRILN